MTDLKPCPFCGADETWLNMVKLYGRFHVQCMKCDVSTILSYDENNSAKMWNRRCE